MEIDIDELSSKVAVYFLDEITPVLQMFPVNLQLNILFVMGPTWASHTTKEEFEFYRKGAIGALENLTWKELVGGSNGS
jgi:hypothetical protein